MLSGDQSWAQGENYLNIPNMVNIMPRAEYAKMIAGCCGCHDHPDRSDWLPGPLINDETRRLASSPIWVPSTAGPIY